MVTIHNTHKHDTPALDPRACVIPWRRRRLELVKPALEGGVVAELVDELLEGLLVDLHAVLGHGHHVGLALVVLGLEGADDAVKVLSADADNRDKARRQRV